MSRGHIETCWGESYSAAERKSLTARYVDALQTIAAQGRLALHFTITKSGFAEQYFSPVCNWLSSHAIRLSKSNYLPYYFVYALLTGPQRFQLFAGRSILVVTSADQPKRTRIDSHLRACGASGVHFYKIPPNGSLKFTLPSQDLPPADVALVGAGIGAAHILVQLASLKTVCIDAGACIDCMAEPPVAYTRVFMVPDDRWETALGTHPPSQRT
jgi:hypothetical protein